MIAIIWYHIKACRRDLRSSRLVGELRASRRQGGQVVIGDDNREWRLR